MSLVIAKNDKSIVLGELMIIRNRVAGMCSCFLLSTNDTYSIQNYESYMLYGVILNVIETPI